eukprot:gnl/MRDRNA2_/MRDRNA2_87171_c0_seq1.p1 gnl/MRDRNA2_/MRDRNA2_87171_c0~~gnl/MRDRNA2_/MRDRNA2_87171_c0_seq1.p1  ORF type:complete len:730 (+),score=175.58 gnl/MRDRNA2_/MRDRNA2_87171_c0_seq1:89-2278(+)
MPIVTAIPQRNTFIHFADLPDVPMDRSVTCPGNFVPLARACSNTVSACSMDLVAPMMPDYNGYCESNIVPLPVWPHPVCEVKEADDCSPIARTDSVCSARAWPEANAGASSSTDLCASTMPFTEDTKMHRTESNCSSLFHYANGQKKRWTDLPQDPELSVHADDAASVATVPGGMVSDILPQKNTFVHFEDDELPNLYPNRSITCPESTICKEFDSYSPEEKLDLSENECKSSDALPVPPNTPNCETLLLQGQKMWADISEDELTPAHLNMKGHTKWTELSEDEPAAVEEDGPAVGEEEAQRSNQRIHISEEQGMKRWADLSEDEDPCAQEEDVTAEVLEEAENVMKDLLKSEEPSDETGSTMSCTSSVGLDTEHDLAQLPKPSRPQFAKPTREARIRQFQAKVDELFQLNFDEVDPSQQDGLTHRMLVGLKSLAEKVNFWQADGTQVSEEGFKLLGLEEDDMYALGRVIRKAEKFLDERRFREAYDKLSAARRWFDPNTLIEERTKASSLAEKKAKKEKSAKKDKKAGCNSDTDEHGEDDHDEWTQVTKKDKKKLRDEAPKKENSRGKSSTQVTSTKHQFSNASHQTSGLRPQTSGAKSQNGQGRKGPQKLLCRYKVGIEQDRAFNVVQKLLGDRGSHMKTIAANTGSKLRIRGRGSGFLEGPDQKEASDEPLMLCISASTREGFDGAVEDVESLLEHVHDEYRAFCQHRNLPSPRLSVRQDEQPAHH